ncbi:helix-turn-helix domain-containing protein [Aquimarina sp. U1-2]|uniref:AraC family transcriptional regulator n=1 Tax=Aquimarina sp. U1-2 TaxID=2823141 RepID=UPI001AECD4DD
MYSLSFEVGLKSKDQFGYAISFYEQHESDISKDSVVLQENSLDSIALYKKLAYYYADVNKAEQACIYIEKYIGASLDVTFVDNSRFTTIQDSKSYQILVDKYLKKFDWWAIFCFYVAFVGFFLSIVLNLRKSYDRLANFLMSAFVLLHSCFMVHMGLYFMNYEYYLPHTLYLFTTFSLLYGPLIFFYVKRVTQEYKFKLADILHLVPTVLLISILLPVYLQPASEKLRMVIHYERPYLTLISISKLTSLLIYGVFIIKMYFHSIRKNMYISKIIYSWQRNIIIFCSIYIASYAIYSILNMLHLGSGLLFNIQVASLAMMVLYVSYSAFVQPSLFGRLQLLIEKPEITQAKYEKSGLTQSLSLELKSKLLYLLKEEKIYKQNDISLQKLSDLLDTTRHNTSQIINEHFDLNFFELMNKYRIEEATELLKQEKHKNFNIIDVAYEVGFNNKVTFNRSFKKYNQITPSEYLKRMTI